MNLEEIDKFLQIFITICNVLLSIILLGMCIYISNKPYEYMSKSLKIYFKFCLEPFSFLIITFSIFNGFYFFIVGNNSDSMIHLISRFISTICLQQVRLGYLFIILSRITATLFYKHYSKHSSSFRSLAATIALTYLTSIGNGYFEFLRIFFDLNTNFYTIYIVLSTHAATLILCKILHMVNRIKYKSLAYQSSLSQRHQIYENVKVLKALWPLILIFSLIAPLGPLALLSYKLLMNTLPPPSLFVLAYNISFFVIIIIILFACPNTC